MTKRVNDINGWFEIKRNPISKVGVFPYSGRSIGAPDPDRIYKVYRPAEELASQATIDSFKLLPWTDDHTFLGAEADGLTPAEKKGIHGVIGETVVFDSGVLYGNIKLFSDKLKNLIGSGKRELSAGYRCVYKFAKGVYDGQEYDAIQCDIRGNHLALVDQGRMGPDVAVMDSFKITIDSKEFQMPAEPKIEDQIKAALDAALKPVTERLDAMDKKAKEAQDAFEEKEKEEEAAKKKAEDEAKEKEEKEKEEKKESGMDKAEVEKIVTTAVDAALKKQHKEIFSEVAQRDTLAKQLAPHIGSFDSAEKTLNEVAKYGIEKLKLPCADGQELAVLKGFLHERAAPSKATITAEDKKGGAVDAYLKGQK